MRGEELLDLLELVDPVYIEEADVLPPKRERGWGKWIAAAACIGVIAGAGFGLGQRTVGPSPAPSPAAPTASLHVPAEPAWEAHYNQVAEPENTPDMVRRRIPGYFVEELSEEELAAVVPDVPMEWGDWTGQAGFDGEGKLIEVVLRAGRPENDITVVLTQGQPFLCGRMPDGETSSCGGVEYILYEQRTQGVEPRVDLQAIGMLGGVGVSFTLNTPETMVKEAKEDFQYVLECFAQYKEGRLDLTAVTAEKIPEWFERAPTHAEARKDPEFGPLFLPTPPEGFQEESIRRYRDQREDFLSGTWCRGYACLTWTVRPFTEEDAVHVVHLKEKEKYDLRLYPIPRAESVPEALRAVVDTPIFLEEELGREVVDARAYRVKDSGDAAGWRMSFTVKYGGRLVTVASKGVDPEWVLEQLETVTAVR